MIQSNELRIGNWVFSKETQNPQQITALTEENPFINAITFDYTLYDEIEPIPLTEEILFKCGFVRDTDTDYRYFHGDYIAYDLDDGGFRYHDNWSFPQTKYLHELQNLFYAILAEELEVTL